jgi:hypothetical protein
MAGPEPYELFVHILGELPPSQHTFSISAAASDSVANLKRKVYGEKQNRFKSIDADDLVLWKVLQLYYSVV